MAKIASIILLFIICFNNFAHATLWPGNEKTYYGFYYENFSKKNIEIINFCKEKNYQTSIGYSNCLKSLNYPKTKIASNFFLY